MHIKFKKVEIKNFLSIQDGVVDLSNQGYVLINGINKNIDDAAKSNGAGKSSIVESIVYALTNETIRNTKDVVNRYTAGGCRITLDFSVDDKDYKIIRTKEDSELGTNLKLFVNGEDKSGKGIRDTQKILEEYLPDLNAQLIGSVIVLGQGLPQRFTNNTPSGRKEVLERLSKSDYMIEEIKDKLSARRTQLNDELRKCEDLILSKTSKRELLERQLQKLELDRTQLVSVDFDSQIKDYEKQITLLESNQIDSYHYSQQLYEQLNNKIKEYQDWSAKVNSNYNHECEVLDEYYNIYDIKQKINTLETSIRIKKENIDKLDSVKDICPTCGQKLPDVHKVDTTMQKAELEELKTELNNTKECFESISKEIDVKKKEVLTKLNEDTDKIKKEGQELRELYNDISNDEKNYRKELDETKLLLERVKLNKETFEKQSTTIDNDIENTKSQIDQLSKEIQDNSYEKTTINDHLAVVSKFITIATRDFRGFLLSEIIKFINNKAKEYCLELNGTDKIDFTLDGNNINIAYSEKEYESLSGGEKQKVDLIIQFAIRDMLCQFMNFSSNLIAIDEVFDNLDVLGCQNVINLLTTKLNDIESIFIITHHSDTLEIPYDKQIFVIKDGMGVSKISE